MPDSSKILLRVRSPEGTKRIEINSNENSKTFFDKVKKEFNVDSECHIYLDQSKNQEIDCCTNPLISTYKLKNGDMLYMDAIGHTNASISTFSSSELDHDSFTENKNVNKYKDLKEDEIDVKLNSLDGRINRPFSKSCNHSKNSKCIHCTLLEPFDENFMKSHDPPIKYLSFHSYLKKLMSNDKSKNVILEKLSCKIKNCSEHKPWPKGICTKCQPNAITLTGQQYRHIDNIVFENGSLVEKYLDFWRKTGLQRGAYLYGYYTSPSLDKKIDNSVLTTDNAQKPDQYLTGPPPLSIQAIVTAIYEPPQEDTRDYIQFNQFDSAISSKSTNISNSFDTDECESEKAVDYIAEKLGLRRIGWIFTDLIPVKGKNRNKGENKPTGKVKWLRNKDTYILSASEIIIAANFQNLNPNVTKLSSDNVFGSKFITVVVTGDENESIHFEGYQVSEQCCALVRDNCLLPIRNNPSYAFVKPSTNSQYVPDVYYKEKDRYGNEILKHAGPFPVEYLIINVPASHPLSPSYSFNRDPQISPFPVENRIRYTDDNQTFYTFAHHIKPYLGDHKKLFEAFNDFHLLIYLANMDILPMKDDMDQLLLALKTGNQDLFEKWCKTDNWLTLQKLIEMEGPSLSPQPNFSATDSKNVPASTVLPHLTRPFHENFQFSSQHDMFGNDPTNLFTDLSTNDPSASSSSGISQLSRNILKNSSNPSKRLSSNPEIIELDSDSDDPDFTPSPRKGIASYRNRHKPNQVLNQNVISSPTTDTSWTCKHCTFLNQKHTKIEGCEVCGLPEE